MADKVAERLLRKMKRVVSGGAAYDDIEIGPVPAGEEWHLLWMSSVDETNTITKRGQAVKSGGLLYWIDEDAVTTADFHHGDKLELILGAGESLVTRLTGCTSLDVLKVFVVGHYHELGENL